MIVTFRTKAHANIIMFGDIAIRLMKLMGHSGTVPGAFQARDIPVALDRLSKAVAYHQPEMQEVVDSSEDDPSSERPIHLRHRALPLIDLLTAAAAKKCDVMWD